MWMTKFCLISFLDESYYEMSVCFSQDADTFFQKKTIKQVAEERQSDTLLHFIPYRTLMWLRKDPHSFQVWILGGSWNTQTAHH